MILMENIAFIMAVVFFAVAVTLAGIEEQAMNEDTKQSTFEGWAIVEIMGHQRHIGFVTTQVFGTAALFRIDSPGLDAREFVLAAPTYATVNGENVRSWCPAGSKVQRPALPPLTVMVGPSTIYRMTPCTEQAARQAIENLESRPLILLELPEGKQIAAAPVFDFDERRYSDDEDGDAYARESQ